MSSESNILHPPNQGKVGQRTLPAACVNCHERKVRCDSNKRGFPCSNCITYERPNCRKHEKRKRQANRFSTQFVPIRRKSISETQGDRTSSNALVSPTNAKLKLSHSRAANVGSGRHLVEFVGQQEVSGRSILRGVRIAYVGKDVSNMNFLIRQRDLGENDAAHHFAADDIAGRFIAHEPDQIPVEAIMVPDQSLADELIGAYFTHVNPGCPLVDEDIFMEQYRRNPAEPPSLLVLQAIFLVGAHVSHDRPNWDALKATFFRRAKMLFDARLEKNRDFIIQAALLLSWHSDGPDDTEANAWFWVGVAARTAMGIGLHRDRSASTLIHIDMRSWRRLWWILVQFDVAVALFYGRPQAINLDECDVKPLAGSDFEGCGPNVQIDYIIKRTELCVLISRVLRERFGLRASPEDRNAALGRADEALAGGSLSLPPNLHLNSSNMTLWNASLHLTYNNFLIILHRPHPKASTQPDSHGVNDSDICSSSANTIASIFEDLRARDQIKFLWISDINALFTTMVQISVELRFSNPILAINALRRFDSSLLSLRSLIEYWTNAEWILRVFEESSHVQHGIRLGKGSNSKIQSSNNNGDETTVKLGESTNSLHELTGLDALTQAQTTVEPIGAAGQDPQVDASDLIDPMTGSVPQDMFMTPDEMESMMPLDSEWREIYWQEPGISESFADGFWGGWP